VQVLNLLPHFEQRQIRPDSDWETVLYPALKGFLLEAAKSSQRLRLILDAHLTLSFAAGSVLDIKSGRVIELVQRTLGKSVWAPDDVAVDPAWPQWSFTHKKLSDTRGDVAVAIGLTHGIAAAVETYANKALPGVGKLLVAELTTGPSARSVICGRHAFDLAESLTAKIRVEHGGALRGGRVHLFLAGPGCFAFFLGQRHAAIGPSTLYEYDFEGLAGGSYEASLSLPVR
jgi:SMODS-associated and fused to various effectors sensor domain